jgi:uncharacterized protein HemX
MPLKLRAPRPGKSPNYQIRGTYLGIKVEKTMGTSVKRVAHRILTKLRKTIENMSVMCGSASEYRRNAAECRELARHVTSAEGEQKLEKMAQAWDQLSLLSEVDRILTLADERLINRQMRP